MALSVQLPGGYLDDHGEVHREVVLRELTGRDEERLAASAQLGGAAAVSAVLASCVECVGAITDIDEAFAQQLLVADRQVLLLKLRELSFGDTVSGELKCPWMGCGSDVSIDFSLSDIPVETGAPAQSTHRVDLKDRHAVHLPDGSVHESLAFRLPNGSDEEALVGALRAEGANPASVLTQLLARCLQATADWPADGAVGLAQHLSPATRRHVESALINLAPSVDLDMEVQCPTCRRAFTSPFELADFFFGELRVTPDLLYRQVHYLAFHYHWSEREILQLSRGKRQHYIDILADEIDALNGAN